MDDAKLMDELIRDEGMRLTAYKDSVGLWTIGVGHLLGMSQRMETLSDREAQALLGSDIEVAIAVVHTFVPGFDSLDEVRQRALVNMAFNLGSRLGKFVKFLAAVEIQDWPTAAQEMMASEWALQVKERAVRLRDMILTGTEAI